MQKTSNLTCSSCEDVVIHQWDKPISLHRNSARCAQTRNSRLEFPSANILQESYPSNQNSDVPEVPPAGSLLSASFPLLLPLQKATLYKKFLAVASSGHRLDFSLSLHFYLHGGNTWPNVCVLQTNSGSLVEAIIVSVSTIPDIMICWVLLFLLLLGNWIIL